MKHGRGIVGLWGRMIPLGDRPMTGGALDALIDGYGASMDIFPVCRYPSNSRSAEKIWADFVRVAMDANKGLENAKLLASKADASIRRAEHKQTPASLRKVSVG